MGRDLRVSTRAPCSATRPRLELHGLPPGGCDLRHRPVHQTRRDPGPLSARRASQARYDRRHPGTSVEKPSWIWPSSPWFDDVRPLDNQGLRYGSPRRKSPDRAGLCARNAGAPELDDVLAAAQRNSPVLNNGTCATSSGAHGLPRSRYQVRVVIDGKVNYRRVSLRGVLVAVELDGRLAHPTARWRDSHRDTQAAVQVQTCRYAATSMLAPRCTVPKQAQILRRRGWRGILKPAHRLPGLVDAFSQGRPGSQGSQGSGSKGARTRRSGRARRPAPPAAPGRGRSAWSARLTWVFAVSGLTTRRPAISLLDSPRATSSTTSFMRRSATAAHGGRASTRPRRAGYRRARPRRARYRELRPRRARRGPRARDPPLAVNAAMTARPRWGSSVIAGRHHPDRLPAAVPPAPVLDQSAAPWRSAANTVFVVEGGQHHDLGRGESRIAGDQGVVTLSTSGSDVHEHHVGRARGSAPPLRRRCCSAITASRPPDSSSRSQPDQRLIVGQQHLGSGRGRSRGGNRAALDLEAAGGSGPAVSSPPTEAAQFAHAVVDAVAACEDRGVLVRCAVAGHRESQAVGPVAQAQRGCQGQRAAARWSATPARCGMRISSGQRRWSPRRSPSAVTAARSAPCGEPGRSAPHRPGIVQATGLGPPELAEHRPHLGQGSPCSFP